MSADRLDMTGLWHGTYVYPGFAGPTTPFVANLVDADGRLSGTTLEPNLTAPVAQDEVEAVIAGARDGRAVDFIKTYDGSVFAHAVDYVGQLSADGSSVTGMWSVEDVDGTFEMHRDVSLEELVAGEAEEELTVPQEDEGEVAPR